MKDLTQGRVDAHLLRMASAILLSMVTGAVFSLSNLYWLGLLGAKAQAAATLAGIPVMLLHTGTSVVALGAGILISHAVGAGDRDRALRIFNEAFSAILIAMVAIGTIAWFGRDAAARALSPDPATAGLLSDYFRWFVPAIVAQMPMFAIAIALEFTGNVRIATIAQTGMAVLNAVLAPVLMLGWLGAPRMGIAGAGLASLLSCGLALTGLLIHCLRRDAYLRLLPALWMRRPRVLNEVLKIGLPTGMESGLIAVSMLFIAVLLRPFDPVEQAAFGIGHRLFQAALMPLMALSSAIAMVVGQSHGAGLPERVRETLRAGLAIAAVVGPALLLVFELFAPQICDAFTDDPAAIAAGTAFVRIGALTLLPSGFAYVAFGLLAGVGKTRSSLYAQMVYLAMLVLPAWGLSQLPQFAPTWLWTTMAVAGFAQATMAALLLRAHLRAPAETPAPVPVAEAGAA
jgi:putative MATE family efflux protein